MYIQEKYLLARDLFNAVPPQRAAQIAHCSKEEGWNLKWRLLQTLMAMDIQYQPRGVQFSDIVDIQRYPLPEGSSILRRPHRWGASTPPTQHPNTSLREMSPEPSTSGGAEPRRQGPYRVLRFHPYRRH